jgi:amidohydrolase
MHHRSTLIALLFAGCAFAASATAADAGGKVDAAMRAVAPRVVEWRRDLHRNPELGNREFRTSKKVAAHLESLGLEVRTGIAHTGVVGILRGARPGPVVALRADMDALPVTERAEVPFRSTVTADYRGEQVGVMHACGHDGHTAILMGVAEVLAGQRKDLPGTVLFVFQPAEEGAPEGEDGGAPLMLTEGVFRNLNPDAMFGLHLWASLNAGQVGYRSGALLAAADTFRIVVKGRQTHGARPWAGVDPIVAASHIVTDLQTIVSRQTDISRWPAVVSVGAIKGGIRFNIIPDSVEMMGTIRTFDPAVRAQVIENMRLKVEHVAAAHGATATLEILPDSNPVTVNDPELTRRILPALQAAVGSDKVVEMPFVTASEDFSYFAQEVPSVYVFVGSTPVGQDPAAAPANHSPLFYVDESSLDVGLRALVAMTLDYLQAPAR